MSYLIKDKIFKPYKIRVSNHNIDVIEKTGTNKEGDDVNKLHGHFQSIPGALRKIAKLLTNKELESKTVDFNKFIETLDKHYTNVCSFYTKYDENLKLTRLSILKSNELFQDFENEITTYIEKLKQKLDESNRSES